MLTQYLSKIGESLSNIFVEFLNNLKHFEILSLVQFSILSITSFSDKVYKSFLV